MQRRDFLKTGVATTFINKSCDETTLLDLKGLCDLLWDEIAVSKSDELNPESTVLEIALRVLRTPQGQARLAHTPRTGEGDQPRA